MEDSYYQKRYEEVYAELRSSQKELNFYKKLMAAVVGLTSGPIALVIYGAFWSGIFFLIGHWGALELGSQIAIAIALAPVLAGCVFGTFKYGSLLINWPEVLFHNQLRREREEEKLKNGK